MKSSSLLRLHATTPAAALRFLDKSPPDVAEVREALTCIVSDADRASDVVDRIGSLIKKAPPRKEVVDLNAAILEVTALTHGEAVKTGVTVATQLAGDSHASDAIGCNCNK